MAQRAQTPRAHRGHQTRYDTSPRPFSLLVKPAGPDCNLACDYCFYLKKAAVFPERSTHRMSERVLEAMVASYMQTEQTVYSFGWQGGEPTLMGLSFFQRVVELQKRFGRPGSSVANGLQTNGTLIDNALAKHLATYRFLVGISLDGPASMHDRHRRYPAGAGSHAKVLETIERLRSHGVEVNVLILVSMANVNHAVEVYDYITALGVRYLQYIPCVETNPEGTLLPFAITGEQWGEFLVRTYDRWREHDTHRISIRDFDTVMGFYLDGSYSSCTIAGRCDHYFVVEHNGDVFPCDFYVEPELRLGNVTIDSWSALAKRPIRQRFAAKKAQWADACESCEFLHICSGDCPKQRLLADGRSHLCEGWKRFYSHALPDLRALTGEVAKRRGLHGPLWSPHDVDPEAPCFCGSGRKARNCHLKHQVASQSSTS